MCPRHLKRTKRTKRTSRIGLAEESTFWRFEMVCQVCNLHQNAWKSQLPAKTGLWATSLTSVAGIAVRLEIVGLQVNVFKKCYKHMHLTDMLSRIRWCSKSIAGKEKMPGFLSSKMHSVRFANQKTSEVEWKHVKTPLDQRSFAILPVPPLQGFLTPLNSWEPDDNSSRWHLAGVGIAAVGICAFAAMAIGHFGASRLASLD